MRKVLKLIMIVVMISISMATVVNAATGSINISTSAAKVKAGETFTITVTGTADENISAFQSSITYEEGKLELVENKAGDKFNDLSGSKEIAVLLKKSDDAAKTAQIYTLKFKVLEGAEAGKTKIELGDSTIALVNREKITLGNESIEVEIEKKAEEKPNTNTNKNNAATNTNTNKNNTSTGNKLPQTGIEQVSVILVVALGILSIVTYVSCRRYRDI